MAIRSRGFTLIEFLVVMSLVAALVMIGQPFIKNILIEGRVPKMVEDISIISHQLRAQAAMSWSTTATPYAALGNAAEARAAAANIVRGKTKAMSVQGSGAASTLTHDLGSAGAAVLVSQAQVVQMGDAFEMTLNSVSRSACPMLAAQMDRRVISASINGVVVKPVGGAMNHSLAELTCVAGDTNSYAFTFQ